MPSTVRSGRPTASLRRSSRFIALALAVVVLGALLAGCLPPPPGTPTSITTDPPLFPAFQAGVTDYVIRCNPDTPTAVHVATPYGTFVSINGTYPRSGVFGQYVTERVGQRFTIAVTTDTTHDATTRYNVRCLPTDFPQWTFARQGSTGAEWYMSRPLLGFEPSYPIIFDAHGVPAWWGPKQRSFYSNVLANGDIVSLLNSGAEERSLDGALVRTIPISGGQTDGHDFLLLPNGNFVLVSSVARSGMDLTAIGGPADTSVLDHVIEEIDPATGNVVWSWDTADHIPVTATDPQWQAEAVTAGSPPYDVYHWNSIEDTGDGYILSFRHLDAVFKIDRGTGDIVWKLGGSAIPQSLTVVDDPVFIGGSHFGGQHDARLNGDGTVSLHDNGSNLGRAPRAVRYAIDIGARTATLVESVSDDGVTASFCCGSARKVAGDDWVIGWGGTDTATENVGGTRHVAFTFPGLVLYRFLPLGPEILDANTLRTAMDQQYPDTGVTETVDPGTPMPFPP